MSTAASPNVTGRLPPRGADFAASMPGTPLDVSWQRMPVGSLNGIGPLGEGLHMPMSARGPERSPSPPASARGALGGTRTPRTPSTASGAAGTGGTIGHSQDDLSKAPAEAREAAWRRREEELKAQIQHLDREKKEVERRLDDDGRQFLEALISLENEVTRLTKQGKRLETEKQEALDRLAVQESEFKRQLGEVERHRDHLLKVMTEEGRELQSRVEKLNGDNEQLSRDKESLSSDLAKAVARADVVVASTPPPSSQALPDQEHQLRQLRNQCEELKDEVTNKEGEMVLMRSQMEIAERKLKLTDMENGVLKSELEALRRGVRAGASPVPPSTHPGSTGV